MKGRILWTKIERRIGVRYSGGVRFNGSYSTISSGHGILPLAANAWSGSQDWAFAYKPWVPYQWEGTVSSSFSTVNNIYGVLDEGIFTNTFGDHLKFMSQRPALLNKHP